MQLTDIINELKRFLGDFYNPVIMIFKIICIILLSILIARIGSFIIKKVFDKQKFLKKRKKDDKKLDTMASLLTSVFRYTVYIISIITILVDTFKLNSILAAAGIGGVAIGLGAQTFIRDIISGFFIVMEDHYAVGDTITVENMTGTVEAMELRITKLRGANGDLYIIPNSEIKKVTNHSRGGSENGR